MLILTAFGLLFKLNYCSLIERSITVQKEITINKYIKQNSIQ